MISLSLDIQNKYGYIQDKNNLQDSLLGYFVNTLFFSYAMLN